MYGRFCAKLPMYLLLVRVGRTIPPPQKTKSHSSPLAICAIFVLFQFLHHVFVPLPRTKRARSIDAGNKEPSVCRGYNRILILMYPRSLLRTSVWTPFGCCFDCVIQKASSEYPLPPPPTLGLHPLRSHPHPQADAAYLIFRYRTMNDCVQRWKYHENGKAWSRIAAHKEPLMEPRTAAELKVKAPPLLIVIWRNFCFFITQYCFFLCYFSGRRFPV